MPENHPVKSRVARTVLLVVLALPAMAFGQPAVDPDPLGVLVKPIPDKLVVLTFDDSPASHATIVAPILKSLGFGGTFYVCDFDGFKTRKDWYMTWRQMKALAAEGFEIGNHTVTHYTSLNNFLNMEDELLANNCPKPTTVCWPLYQADPGVYAALAANGYTFGRGGHERPYRPTVDNPFDVPSFTIKDGVTVEAFIDHAHEARQGRVVVYCFHGVPDREHTGVSLDPATFKVMMQYLKDNHCQCIAMRDMAAYIDPAKALKLPPTASNVTLSLPSLPVRDSKPYVVAARNDIQDFSFPNLPPVDIVKTDIRLTVPYATDVTALAPNIKVPEGATVVPASAAVRDFSRPQTYTVTSRNSSQKTYTVTVDKAVASAAKEILTFELPGATSATIAGSHVGVYVPGATELRALTPTFTVSSYATAVPASGTARDFTKPQTYTVTAQDCSSRVFSVTVVKGDRPNAFTWGGAAEGNLSDAAKWSNTSAAASAPLPGGRPDYILSFTKPGNCAVVNDLRDGFQLNQLNLGVGQGNSFNLEGKGLAFTLNRAAGLLPGIRVNAVFERTVIAAPLTLGADLTVRMRDGCEMEWKGLLSGPGALILDPISPQPDAGNYGFRPCVLQLSNGTNTYSGGTIIHGGRLMVYAANRGLGTGPVMLGERGTLRLDNVEGALPLASHGGLIEGGPSWDAPITLKGNTRISGNFRFNQRNGGMGGPGGLTLVGGRGPWGWENTGSVSLFGVNTYTGPTVVLRGTLFVKKAVALYHSEAANWTAAKISVHPAATLVISAGGPGEFSGDQAGALLTNLTAAVDENGLMGRSLFCLDTTNAAGVVNVSADIADAKGPGGGAFVLKKCGAGVLQLSGNSSYTGQTILEAGTLSVASLNSVVNGRPGSSLRRPVDVDAGEIVLGDDGKDGDCALVYTGPGEITDRVMNFVGKQSTVTFDQSGSGLLKFTSTFLLSGYGAGKTIILKGDTAGRGEIAGNIVNPHDRAGKATTAVTKLGSGTWTLSGTNSYSGPTKVGGGVLACARAAALGGGAVDIRGGAKLELNYSGTCRITALTLKGRAQAAGSYGSTASPATYKNDACFFGPGTVTVVP